MIRLFAIIAIFTGAVVASAATENQTSQSELLVKMAPISVLSSDLFYTLGSLNQKPEHIFGDWYKIHIENDRVDQVYSLQSKGLISFVQKNTKLGLLNDYKLSPAKQRVLYNRLVASGEWARIASRKGKGSATADIPDNLDIPLTVPEQRVGADPDLNKQWGMVDNHVSEAWKVTLGSPQMIVAVIDTGVDYTHEDLLPNMWRNPGETGTDANGKRKENNAIDDDNNGYVDDVVGWDFASKDNKPYDLAVDPIKLLFGGGNPGHGTHCAGNVAARGGNAIGISGVAPNVKIMALRFITEKGQGTTEDAVKSIIYAVDNGAKVLSNSWGGESDPNDAANENKILKDAIEYARAHNVLFIAAAGNGRNGVGFNMDTDKNPVLPGGYQYDNIITVAATDINDNMGAFSNYGAKLVHIGAPGVKIYSTTWGSHYSDMVIDKMGFKASWDGTSMATPHVAGAAALYWSAHPEKTYLQVREAILRSAKPIPSLNGKVSTGGKLDVRNLLLNY